MKGMPTKKVNFEVAFINFQSTLKKFLDENLPSTINIENVKDHESQFITIIAKVALYLEDVDPNAGNSRIMNSVIVLVKVSILSSVLDIVSAFH